MDLPNLFSARKKKMEEKKLFLGILLSDNNVQAALWTVESNNVVFLTQSSRKEYKNERDCLIKTDETLQELGPDSENVNEVVFGFEPGWVANTGIVDERKPLLKKLTQELSLEPVGFVVVTEALVQDLISKESLLSCLLLYINHKNIFISLLKQGKLLDTIQIGRSEDIQGDLREGFARIKSSSKVGDGKLPSKVYLISLSIDQDTLTQQQQEMLSIDWSAYPFLQPPVVELLPINNMLQIVTKQGGVAVAQSQGLISPEAKDTAGTDTSGQQSDAKTKDKVNREARKGALGQKPTSKEEYAIEKTKTQASSFGIPISEDRLPDIKKEEADENEELIQKSKKSGFSLFGKKSNNKVNREAREGALGYKAVPDKIFSNPLLRILAAHKKMVVGGIVFGLAALIVVGYLSITLSYQALLKIKLKTVIVAKEVEIVLDPEAEKSDPENLTLKASLVTSELNEIDTIETTGVKLVGEQATGKVTIFNKANEVKIFEKGTVLSKGDLQFTLDEEVKVASASVEAKDGGEEKEYGRADINVTATEIGADYNLAKDEELQISSFASGTYSAKVAEDLSGGASREIRVVAEQDRIDLLAELSEELLEKAEEKFDEESGNGRYLVSTGELEKTNIEFDAEIADEVDTLTLDLTVEVTAIEYLSEDLKPLAEFVLASEVPEGYVLIDEKPEILSSPTEDDFGSGAITLAANVSSKAKPEYDENIWKEEVKAKSLDEGKKFLEEKEIIEEVEIKLWPSLASAFMKNFPKKVEKIMVKVVD